MAAGLLTVDQAEAYFRDMLSRAGVAEMQPDALKARETFKQFAKVPVECQDDGLLFEVLPKPDEDSFTLHFTRQFSFYPDDDEENDDAEEAMYQLNCEFTYPLDGQLRGLTKSVWAYYFEDYREAFFQAVEALPEFRIPMFDYTPAGMQLGLWQED